MSKKKIARILLVLAVVASLTLMELTPLSMVQDASAVTQADIDKLKDELSGMNSEKSQLEKELKSIQNDKSAALAQKENIDKQINLLQSEIKGVESLISEYETLITQTEQEIRENEEEEARQYEKFCERVRSMEERGTVSYWSVLFDSASFSDLLSAMDFISEIMDSDQKVIDDLRALREQIEQKKASLETSLAEQQSAKETLVAKKSELNTQRAEAEKVLAELKANEAQYKQILSEKDAAMERQQAEIVRLSRELAEKNGNTTVTYGGYIWPCSSKYITSPLGARYTGIAGASRNHAGIDIGRVGYTTQAVAAMENPPALYYYLIHADRTDIWPERDAEWFRLPPMAADHPLLRCAAERRPLPDGFPPAEKYSLIQSYTSQDLAAYNGYLLAFAKNDELVFRVERLPSRT